MNGTNPFEQDRIELQGQRRTLDHRESVKTSVRMVRSVLGERADRLARDAEHARSDEDLVGYLEDLLEVHDSGSPDLGFLQADLSTVVGSLQGDHPEKYQALKLPSQSRSEVFPVALEAYVSGSGGTTLADVGDSFRAVVGSGEAERVAALAWFFAEHLHRIADDGVRGARTELQQDREAHVARLEDADDPANGTDPLAALEWNEPVAMLPVRLETSFVDAQSGGGDLRVRVYPEQLHVDSHEEELTEAEYEWGTAFWAQVWFLTHEMPANPGDTTAAAVHGGSAAGNDAPADRLPDDRLRSVVEDLFGQLADGAFSTAAAERFEEVRDRAWQRGVERFGTERAAYVVHALAPDGDSAADGERLLEGPPVSRWVQSFAEFQQLAEWEQVLAFVRLDADNQRWVLRELAGQGVLDSIDGDFERLRELGRRLVSASERRRFDLLESLRSDGRLDGAERETIERLFRSAVPIEGPLALSFPDVDFRPESWTQPPRARLLPDRWVVYAYWDHPEGTPNLGNSQWSTDWRSAGANAWRRWDDDREQWVKKVTGPAIREPLPVGPSPEDVAGDDDDTEGMEWMIDFGVAKSAGMGLRFGNPDDGSWNPNDGYERLVVTGVRTSGDPDRTADELADLLAAQQYTQGLSLLEQGTPTNNADEPSGHSSKDDAEAAAPTKVGAPLVPVDDVDRDEFVPLSGSDFDADGTRLARALDVDPATFAHVEGADTVRHVDAGHANEALWPATWGYYVKHLLVPDAWNSVLGGESMYGAADGERPDWAGVENDPARTLATWLAKFRDHFREHVRGGGPLHTLAVGNQPYGVLPATPLAVDAPADSTAEGQLPLMFRTDPETGLRYLDPERLPEGRFLATLVEWVEQLRTTWLRSADAVPRVGDGSLDDQRLLDLLSMEATPQTLRRQSWLLDDVSAVWRLFDRENEYVGNFTGSSRWHDGHGASAVQKQNLAHIPAPSSPRIASMRFFGESGLLADADALVDDSFPSFLGALRGTLDDDLYAPLASGPGPTHPGQWLRRLRTLGGYWRWQPPGGFLSGFDFESPADLPANTGVKTARSGTVDRWDDLMKPDALASANGWLSVPGDLSTASSVLRTLLHFGTLREVASSRIRLGALYDDPLDMDPDPAAYAGDETIYRKLLAPLGAGETGPLANHPALSNRSAPGGPTYADAVRAAAADVSPPVDPYVDRFARSLDHLAALDPDDLEDHAMETLGLASHRLDAWWTSIATRQLWNLRGATHAGPPGGSRSGVLVGAFGYVEDLAPEPDETGEYLLAPSQNQVTTAAVLRSAHAATDDDAHADALAVDLSAERVRRARSLLDGVRDGRPLSVLLGYRFERRLRELTRDREQPDLQQYVSAFRSVAPLRASKADRKGAEHESPGHAKRSDVVDGQALYRTWKDGGLPWDERPLDRLSSAEEDAVEFVLEEFDRSLDAVNDVLTAEAVHQLSKGNPDRASAALEGIARGKQLPELEVLRTPRREAGVNNRLAVLFGDAAWRDETTSRPLDSKYALRKWEMERAELVDPETDLETGATAPVRKIEEPGADLLGPESERPVSNPADAQSGQTVGVRHVGEPNLNGWVGELLPQPDRVRCQAAFHWDERRDFATGTFETPTEPGVVTVTDVGFDPDVLVFRVTNAVEKADGKPDEAAVHGWTHGVFHDADAGPARQHSTSIAVADDGTVTEHGPADRALGIVVPGEATTPGIAGAVDATLDDGFQVNFERAADASLVVQYQAIKTGDNSAVRVGHFATDDVASAPSTQAVDLDTGETITDDAGTASSSLPAFDPDHLLLTASNAVEPPNGSGSPPAHGSLVGFSHGEAVRTDDDVTQQAVTTALDPTGTGHAVGFGGDAAIKLPYGSGEDVTEATTARVTALGRDSSGRPRVELEYQQPDESGVSLAGYPQLVTYVAFESPTTEEPVRTTHRPAVGYAAAPADEGDSVTIDPGFDPGCVEVAVCPSLAVAPGTSSGAGQSPPSVLETATGTAGWSHGVATDLTDQRVLHEAVRPQTGEDAAASQQVDAAVGIGSGTDLVSVAYLDGSGSVAGRDVGRLGRMDEDGITIEFPELHSASGDERPLVVYRVWPARPTEQPYAVETSVTLESLDLSPLDAVSLSQVDAQPGLSQLERRLRYYLFRHRPDHHPPVPDDADVELTFAETGTDERSHVSFAQYLEQARSVRDLLGDGRPVDAEDLAHPSEAAGPGYLPADSGDESASAAELRERADAVQERLDAARAIVDDRLDLFDVPEGATNVCDQVDRIDRAIDAFGREVPARQLHRVARRLTSAHDPSAGAALLSELETLLDRLDAGPTDVKSLPDDVVVETGGPDAASQTISTRADVDGAATLTVTARSHSPGEFFAEQSWTVETDADGTFEVTFDASGVTPGTRFTLAARPANPPPALSTVLARELRALDSAGRTELFSRLLKADRLDEREAEEIEELVDAPVDAVSGDELLGVFASLDPASIERILERAVEAEFDDLSEDEQIRVFELVDREDKLLVLGDLGRDDLLERYRVLGTGPQLVTTGRVIESGAATASGSLSSDLESSLVIVPRLLWLDRIVEDVRPEDGSPGETLSDALAPGNADWGQIAVEKELMRTVKELTPADAFDDEDFAAVQRLVDLQHVDLSTETGLAGKMDDVIAPAARVGLTEFVALTGDEARPDAQQYWTRDCEVGSVWDRPCEGSVRARLRNFLRVPGEPAVPAEYERFAPEFQRLLGDGTVQPEYVFAIEAMLAHPAALVVAMDGHLDRPEVVLQDLHELLYHPGELAGRVDRSDLERRLSALGEWLETASSPEGVPLEPADMSAFGAYLRANGTAELVKFLQQVPTTYTDHQQTSLRRTYEDEFEDRLGALAGSPVSFSSDPVVDPTPGSVDPFEPPGRVVDVPLPGSTEHTIEERIAPTFAGEDLGPPFRRGVLETLRRGLLRASYAGIYGSTPNSAAGGTPEDQEVLLEQAEFVADALRERVDRASALADADTVADQVERLQVLLGEEFVVLPPFAPSNPAELHHTFGASDDLLDGDAYAVDTWLQRIGRVRDRPAKFRQVLTYADLFDLAGEDATTATGETREAVVRRSLTVGQLPHGAGTDQAGAGPSWVGLDGVTPDGGELSMAALFVTEASNASAGSGGPVSETAGTPPVAGLFVDGWTEKVPETDQTLGVGFRYDDPDARAPQSIVLAVPPSWSRGTDERGLQPTAPLTWSMDALATTLEETTELVRTRSVDLDALDSLGHVLPATCFAYNEDSDPIPMNPEVFLPDAPSVLLDTFEWTSLE